MSDFFTERLKLLRGDKKKAVFARDLGIPAPMYHRYENGQVPKENNLRVIADYCGVTVDWLLGRDNRSLGELRNTPVTKLEKGHQKHETPENIGYSQLCNTPVTKLEKGQGVREDGVPYGLEGELWRMRARMDGVEEELTHMRTQLDTVVGLLGAALGNGIRDKQDDKDDRKAG